MEMSGCGGKVEAFRELSVKGGTWIVLVKGLRPIPYKIVTITSGFAGYNIWLFIVFSIIARGVRFYFFAFLLNRYGAQARVVIEERLGFWFTISVGLLLARIVAALYLF